MAFNIIGDDIQSLSLEQLTMNYNEDRDTNKVTAWGVNKYSRILIRKV